jgi:GDSL-like Lipase/Acylhydrolase family
VSTVVRLLSAALVALSLHVSPSIASAETEPVVEVAPGKKVVLIGDSLAEGMSNRFRTVTGSCGYKRDSFHRRGSTMENWANKIEEIVKKSAPDLVIVSLGTNDSILDDPSPTRDRARKIIAAVKNSGSKIVWVLPPKLPASFKHQDEVRKVLQEELSAKEAFDSQSATFERSEDAIHATANGYTSWFTSVWKKIAGDGIVKASGQSATGQACP